MLISFLSVSFFLTILSEGLCALPKSLKTCSRNLIKPESCIINSVSSIRHLLATGDLGEGFDIPPLEPLALDTVRMSQGNDLNAVFSQLLVNGPSEFVVEKLKANIDKLSFDFTLLLPRLNFTGQYTLKMRILLLNIHGKGDVKGTFKNSRGIVRLRGGKVKRNGVEYIRFNQMQMKIQVSEAKFHLANLFNGDPILGQVGNRVINENSEYFLKEIIPGMEKSLSRTFLNISNAIVKDVTFDEMFPNE